MRNPTEATAMIATTVATVPSSVPCSQRTADTRTPDPAGSDSVSCACATLACIIVATAAISGEILVLIKRNTLYPPPWSLGGGRGLLVYGTSGAPTPESRVCTSTGGVSSRVGRPRARDETLCPIKALVTHAFQRDPIVRLRHRDPRARHPVCERAALRLSRRAGARGRGDAPRDVEGRVLQSPDPLPLSLQTALTLAWADGRDTSRNRRLDL